MLLRKKEFSVSEMIEMERRLKNSELFSQNLSPTDENLSEKLKLKIEYVDELDENVEAELLPIESDTYLGLIKLRNELRDDPFPYIHEIIHFIFDVGFGNKVKCKYTRKKRGKTGSLEEQKTNYMAAAFIMPYEDILCALQKYDRSKPKMDEIVFVRNLQNQYRQKERSVLRRIKEVRKISKSYANISS